MVVNTNDAAIHTEGPREQLETQECSPVCIALGGFGAFLAVVANMATKDVSTVDAVTDALGKLLGVGIPRIGAAALFVVVGIVLVVVSKTANRKQAFYAGLSAIAVVMTGFPQKTAPGFDDPTVDGRAGNAAIHERNVLDFFIGSAVASEAGPVARVKLQVVTRDRKPLPAITVSVRNQANNAVVAQSKITSNSLIFSQAPGSYVLVVDAEAGYQQYTATFVVNNNDGTVELTAQLQPTNVPMLVQRVFRKY